MAASLIEHGAIRTTEAKAKELRRFVERLITTAKKGTLHARRRAIQLLQVRHAVNDDRDYTERWNKKSQRGKTIIDVLFDEIAPRFANRPGGYTRIIRLSERRIGDGGVQVVLQLVEEVGASADGEEKAGGGRRKRRAAKRRKAAGVVQAETPAENDTPEASGEQVAAIADEADADAGEEQETAVEGDDADADTDVEKGDEEK